MYVKDLQYIKISSPKDAKYAMKFILGRTITCYLLIFDVKTSDPALYTKNEQIRCKLSQKCA